MIVSWAIENNLVYLGLFWLVYDSDNFWAIENNLVYLRSILTGYVVVIISGLLGITQFI